MFKLLYCLLFAVVLGLTSLAVMAEPIDINTATAEEMAAALKGVGPKRAAAIVEYRDQHGPFQSVDDLANVKGIGEKILEDNRTNITIVVPSTMDAPAADETSEEEGSEEQPAEPTMEPSDSTESESTPQQ